MMNQALRILQVSTYDTIGGAEKVAWNLFQTYRERAYGSWLAVGHKLGNDPNVLIPKHEILGRWSRFCRAVHSGLQSLNGKRHGSAVSLVCSLSRAECSIAIGALRTSVIPVLGNF